jgi:hypothetical protein
MSASEEFQTSINIFFILIVVALVIKIIIQAIQKMNNDQAFTIATSDNPIGKDPAGISGQADGAIGMYSWTVFWTLCLMVTTISILLKRYPIDGFSCTVSKLFYLSPFVVIIGILISTILINYHYRTKINMNLVPSSYFGWSIGSTVSVIAMFAVIVLYLKELLNCTTSTPGSKPILLTWCALCLSVFIIAFNIVVAVLVACYTTDG